MYQYSLYSVSVKSGCFNRLQNSSAIPALLKYNGGMRRFLYALSAVVIVAIGYGCGDDSPQTLPAKAPATNLPDQIMTDSEIYLTSDGIRKGTIKSESLKVYSRIDTTLLYKVEMMFFDTLGNHTSTLLADSAWVSQRANTVTAIGHVRAWRNDNRRIVADSLRWDAKTEKIVTEGYVEIYRGDDVLTGYGLETDQRLEQTIIKRNPRGTFSEPADDSL